MAYIEYILEYGTKKMEWIDTVEVTLGSWQNKNLPNLFLLQRFRQKGFCRVIIWENQYLQLIRQRALSRSTYNLENPFSVLAGNWVKIICIFLTLLHLPPLKFHSVG
jgi:hypothetical protein